MGLAKLLTKQRVSERPAYCISGHILRFEDQKKVLERFTVLDTLCCLIDEKGDRFVSYLYSVRGLVLANFCKRTSYVISLLPC